MWKTRALFFTYFGIYLWILSGGRSEGDARRRLLDQPKLTSKTCTNCKALILKKKNQTIVKGERLILKCTTDTRQSFNITWLKNNTTLTSSSDIVIKRTNTGSKLKIKVAKLVDSGTYLCLAHLENGKLEYSNTAHVTVYAKFGKSSTKLDKTALQADSPEIKPLFGNATISSNVTVPTSVVQTTQPGYCVPYTGELCSAFLKRGFEEIHLKRNSPQQNIEKKLDHAYRVISTSDRLSEDCKPHVLPLLCHYLYPFCDQEATSPTPRSLCRDECDLLSQNICSREYRMAKQEKLMYVLLPDCSKLPPVGSAGWKTCIRLNIKKHPSPSVNPQKAENCFNGTGEGYRGNKSKTENGLTCQAWNHSKPHFHLFTPSKYPELQGGHNFCRNPGGNKKGPWCYTTDEKKLYEYCDIARCDQLPKIKMVSILYMVIPCLVFAIIVASVVILICWRCHKWMMYQAEQASLLPVIVKTASSLPVKELQKDMIILRKGIGEDQFGKVYYGELNTELDCRCVIKTSRPNNHEDFINQAVKWSSFNHPNVINILGICTQETILRVVYEYLECGTLHDYLLRHSPLDDPNDCCKPDCLSGSDLLSIAVQVADALNYLTNNSYIHGDIATRSCMVGPQRTVKITDISLSWCRHARDYYWEENKRPMPIRWMAPEGVIHSKFTAETDIWSFGVFLWELFSYGDQPHYGYSDEEVIRRIRDHAILECPTDCPEAVYSLMKECWDIMPPSRPQFRTIYTYLCELQHDYDNRVIT